MRYFAILIITMVFLSCNTGKNNNISTANKNETMENKTEPIRKSKEEWKAQLSDIQYSVMIEKGTERPFTGEYWDVFLDGIYKCAACGNELFDSETKFDAHCGWPSFFDSIDKTKIKTDSDYNLGYKRTEIMCANCGAHLGHVFDDGPEPTGQRYCVNSVSIKLDTTLKK